MDTKEKINELKNILIEAINILDEKDVHEGALQIIGKTLIEIGHALLLISSEMRKEKIRKIIRN